MPTAFAQAVAEWQTFYFALGTAAATLTGLLFVAVSLHLDQFAGKDHPELQRVAYKTLVGFVNLLFISLYFLVPHPTPLLLAVALVLTSIVAGALLGRQVPLDRHEIERNWGRRRLLWRFVLPELAQGAITVVAILLYFREEAMLPLLVLPLNLLLGTNVLNAWELLVQVGQEKREEQAERDEHPQFRRLEQQLREVTRRQRQITRQQEDAATHGGSPPPRRRG
jgi:hypothetical protein